MQRTFDDRTLVAGQIQPQDVATLSQSGVTMIINNRVDHEDPGQPTNAEISQAASAAGIAYRHVPIRRGMGPGDVECMREAMAEVGEGKLLAYCRSGARSAYALALAQREEGVERKDVEKKLIAAGFDPGPIQHLL